MLPCCYLQKLHVTRIIIDKRQKPKRSHDDETEEDVIHNLPKIH